MTLVHLLEKWYAKHPSIKPHPAFVWHDVLHVLLDEPPTWEGEIKVGVLEYVYRSLRKDLPLTVEGARIFLQSVLNEVKASNPEAYDFLTENELCNRISASVRILRSVGLENIQSY